ncbi:MAG: hypothetical protein VX938_04245, partial [Myxococcota bacterium]|nr:hypothetical protein [Myxococcota bacterium]
MRRLWPHLLLPAVVLLANAVRVRNCDPIEGVGFYLMGPVASMLVASQVGTGLGILTGGRWLSALVFAGVWLLSLVRVAGHLYLEPQVFAFNPFVGYFAGAVYDDLISIDQRFILFRLSDALVVVGVWGSVGLLSRSNGGGLVDRLRGASAWAWTCFAIGVVGWAAFFGGRAVLGIEIDRAAIRQVLGGVVTGERISVVYAREEIDHAEAERIHRDLRYALDQLDVKLGRPHPDPVEAFIYGSKEQKRALMGAGKVDLAKPWLGEIHVTRPASGDPVLKHELAHVVLGPHGDSLLGVPARAQIFPHMGIVEGAAEALEWSGGSFTLHEWSAAMRQEDLAPPLEQIVGAGGFW